MTPPVASARTSGTTVTVRHRRRFALPGWAYPLAALVYAVIAWDLAIRVFDIKAFILPPPLAVVQVIARDFSHLLANGWVTLQEVLAGFALGVAVGVSLGLLIASWPLAERTLYPLLAGSLAVPKIAIAPLFIIWLGFGIAPKILMAFLLSLFPIVIATATGMRSIETEKLHLARSMGATRWQTFVRFRLPNAMPGIFDGLKLGVTFAVTGAVVGEIFGTDRGLGRLIVVANGNLDTAALFAAVVVLTIMSVLLFLAVDLVQRVVVHWHVSQRGVHHAGY